MDTKQAIQEAFRELLKTAPYGKITVANICDKASVSRKTFYVYFHDKSEIVEQLFLDDIIRPMSELHNLLPRVDAKTGSLLLIEKLYRSFYDHRDYYSNIVDNMLQSQSIFTKIAIEKIYDLDVVILSELGFRGSETELEYASFFFASSQAMLLQKWIRDKMPLSPSEMANLYADLTMPFWNALYEKSPKTAKDYKL